MKTEVKSCPFCGGTVMSVKPDWYVNYPICFVFCESCRASGTTAETKQEAIEAWNHEH